MWIALFKTLEGLPRYGNGPDIPEPLPDPRVEMYNFDISREHWDYVEQDFISPVYHLCDALLDFYDADYLNAEQCAKLKSWLEGRLTRDVPGYLSSIYEKLLEYTIQAVELNTGIMVEL